MFQFYDLSQIWEDINIGIQNQIKVLHLCSEPLSASEVAKTVFQLDFKNNTGKTPFDYDMHTKYSRLWGTEMPYQYSKEDIITQLKDFVKRHKTTA